MNDQCERSGAWETAATLINRLEESGFELTADHFDAALRACDRQARWQEALGLFDRMNRMGLRPTARSFECAIRTAAKAKQMSIVDTLWDSLRKEIRASPPLVASPFTYNVLMRALAEGGGKTAGKFRPTFSVG